MLWNFQFFTFAAAASILPYFKKTGIGVMIIAALIGFSRLYLFVHFPADVLLGAVLGVVLSVITVQIQKMLLKKIKNR